MARGLAGKPKLVAPAQARAQFFPVNWEPPRDPAALERVTVRISTAIAPDERACPTLLVVSALPGEGASSVARGVASLLSVQTHSRVLLVDANLREPAQRVADEPDPPVGFRELATGVARLPDMQSVLEPGLYLLPAGNLDKNPVQAFQTAALRPLFDALRESFDWIVVDGPPLATYPESTRLGSIVDGVALVVRASETRAEVVNEQVKHIKQSGGNLIGAVLNRRRYPIPEFLYRWL